MAKSRANRASQSRPYEVLFQMLIGKWISQALGTLVEFGVPEQLAKRARRCRDIASEAGVSEDGLCLCSRRAGMSGRRPSLRGCCAVRVSDCRASSRLRVRYQ